MSLPYGLRDIDEAFTISVGVSDIDVNAAALLAIDELRLDSMQLGSLEVDVAGCLTSLLYAGSVTQLRATLIDVINPLSLIHISEPTRPY